MKKRKIGRQKMLVFKVIIESHTVLYLFPLEYTPSYFRIHPVVSTALT